MEKKVGDLVEGYRVLREIGRGAASIIYLVQDPKSKQIWALKHVEKNDPKDERFLAQAEAEYRIASELDHRSIRKVERLIKRRNLLDTRELCLVMEFVDGISEERLPPRTFERAVAVFHQIAEALAHMHDRGFVHADMKPNNIIVTDAGVAKIIDLGQSCRAGTVKDRIQGTPDYIAPEQVHRRAITARTDVYNLGATMYWTFTRKHIPTALAGQDALVGSREDHMIERPAPAIELNPRIHPKLNELIMQCVEVDADKRPPTMHWVADRLNLIHGILRAELERTRANGEAPPTAA